jgi:excisionase family DNA binding protein
MGDLDRGGLLDEICRRPFTTVAKAAKVLDTDPRTVRAEIAAGRIPAIPLGQSYRIPTSWLREQARVRS